jgi:hypothetical protein
MPLSSIIQALSHAFGDKLGAPASPEAQEGMKRLLYIAQIALGVAFAFVLFRLRSSDKSGFAVREADLKKSSGKGTHPKPKGPDLASARIERKAPLALEGIRIDGPPHEVLGVAPGATEEEIQRAYRERMKRYHPDKIGRPGSREWSDAQKIAEAINRAKEELVKRARARH